MLKSRFQRLFLIIPIALLAGLALAQSAAAAPDRPPIRTAFTGAVFSQAVNETLDVTGNIQVTETQSSSGITLHASLFNSSATGESTHTEYQVTGAADTTVPPSPIAPVRWSPSFSFVPQPPPIAPGTQSCIPTDPCVPVNLLISFDSFGNMTGVQASVGSNPG